MVAFIRSTISHILYLNSIAKQLNSWFGNISVSLYALFYERYFPENIQRSTCKQKIDQQQGKEIGWKGNRKI